MLGMTPAKAVKLKEIDLKFRPYPKEKVAPKTDYIDIYMDLESLKG